MPGMAWANTLLDCSFRDVVFDVVGTRDSYGRAISVAEIPYVDGGVVEDLGARPVRFSLQAIFFGDDYEVRLDVALKAFNERGVGELQHPVLGKRQVQCVSAEVGHSAPEPDSCTVQLEFIESGEPKAFFEAAGVEQVQAEVGALGDSALDESSSWLADIVTAIRKAAPLAALDELRQSMLGPLLGFVGQTQGVSLSALDVLDVPRAWARDISALSHGVIATSSFGDNLMADWRSVTGVFSRLGSTYGFGSSAASTSSGSAPAWRVGTTPSEAQGVAAANMCLAVNNATAQADVAAVVLAAEAETPTLSPVEIETVVNAVRIEIDVAIVVARAVMPLEKSRRVVEPLKDLALALQQSGQAIIERRPPLTDRTLEAPGNLRLIAHLWYGDHSRALELFRLNGLRNPNALQKGDVLRAFTR